MEFSLSQAAILFGISALAGAVNSVAGGGTLLTFPSLLWVGKLEEIIANATSTVALWPGQLSSLWGYRNELGASHRTLALFAVPSFLGGLVGSVLLLRTSNDTFARLVPYLILLATVLFMVQEPVARRLRRNEEMSSGGQGDSRQAGFSPGRCLVVVGFQFLVAVYGGYFGAGIGILMLAALGFLGLKNIHQMNAIKNISGMCINAVAALLFIVNGLVNWRLALLMATGAILGGYTGAGIAQRIGQKAVRRVIVLIGLSLTISLLIRG